MSSKRLSGYEYLQVHSKQGYKGEHLKRTNIYRFKSKKTNHTYIVNVEIYSYEVYVIKFFLKNHRNSEHKYSLLTGHNEPRRIVNTCINIMLDIYDKFNTASFGFIGAPTFLIETCTCNTKRYTFYSNIVATYFSKENFKHFASDSISGYLLLNKKNTDHEMTLEKIKNMFCTMYNDFSF